MLFQGLLLLIPPVGNISNLSPAEREAILTFEEHVLTNEMEAPVFFAEETSGKFNS